MRGRSPSAVRFAGPARRVAAALCTLASVASLGSGAHAQVLPRAPAPPGASTPASGPNESSPANRASALFQKGVQSAERKDFTAALDDFRASLDLYPTLVAMKNAALCLRELGRFDEALQTLEALPERFPDLSPDEREQNRLKVEELSKQVGWVELRGVAPSSQIAIDDRDRGLAPPSSRVPVSSGPHRIRVSKEGLAPIEVSVVVTLGQSIVAAIDQRPVETPPSEIRSEAQWTVGVEVGGTLTSSLGGDVAGCASPCERSIGGGGRVVARAGRALGSKLSLALDAGYLALGQTVDQRTEEVVAVGLPNPGLASDALSLRGALVGLSLTYRVPLLGDSFVRAGTGTLLARLRDERHGSFKTAPPPGEPSNIVGYELGQTQTQAAYYAYLALAVGIGFRPSPNLRFGAGVDAMVLAALKQPHWDADCGACKFAGGDGESWFANQPLAGNLMVLVSPFVDAGYAF